MTRGEKIAWIWVWSAMALLTVGGAFSAQHYWGYARAYLDAASCATNDTADAPPACERILANNHATREMRIRAYLRLATAAKLAGQHDDAITHLSGLIAEGLATSGDLNDRGVAYYTLRRFTEAAADFQSAIRMDGEVGDYWINLGDAQTEMKDYTAAAQSYTKAIPLVKDPAEVLGNRGWAYYQLDDLNSALQDYNAATKEDPNHADNLNERGLVHHALEDYGAAVADFDRALELRDDSPVILTNRAYSLLRLGEKEKARADLDKAIGTDPGYRAARLERAWLAIDSDMPESALPDLQELKRLAPLSVAELEASCRAQYDLGNWDAAIADADRALALGTRLDWPYELRGKSRREAGDYEGAIADVTTLLSRHPKKVGLLATRALSMTLVGRTDAAVADMTAAVTENNEPAYALEIRSYLQLRLGRVKEAVADARRSVSLASQSQLQYSAAMLGWALLEDGNPAEAKSACASSLAVVPSPGAYSCRATAELELGRLDAASNDAQLALAQDKTASSARIVLGRINLAQKRWADAVENFDQALRDDIFNQAEILMYRGDANKALGKADAARSDYEAARKFDIGLYQEALAERLASLTP
jgi:tetratricopeptide (TPR) repeat protein